MAKSILYVNGSNSKGSKSNSSHFRWGGEEDFNAMFYELYPPLVYYSRRIIGDEIESENLVAEAFVKIWERKLHFETYASLKSFLYTSVRNASLDLLKKEKRLRVHKKEYQACNMDNAEAKFSLEYMIEAEFLRELYASFNKLPARCRKVMQLFFVEGKTYQEIAAELKLSLSTIRNQKARGLDILRRLVQLPLMAFGLFRLISW